MAGPGAKGGMWSKGSNGKRVLITKKMARQMASSGMSAQTDEEYADQASKLRQQNNAEAKANRKADVAARTLKEEVETLKVEVINSNMPKPKKSRIRALIEEMEDLQRQDIKNTAKVLGIAAKSKQITETLLGVKSNPDRVNQTNRALPPTNRRQPGRSRLGSLIDEIEDLNQRDIKNKAKIYGNTAKAMRMAKTVLDSAEVIEPKQLKGKTKRKNKKRDNRN